MSEQNGNEPGELVQRESKQPRFDSMPAGTEAGYALMLADLLTKPELIEPPFSVDTRRHDDWLIGFAQSEPNLVNIISSVVSKDKNRAWELIGGSRQVRLYGDALRNVEGGAGWRHFISMQSRAYYNTSIGAITEVERWTPEPDSYMRSLYHVDPTRARLTGNPSYPLKYYPRKGRVQEWEPQDYFRTVSNPDVREDYRGIGQSAVHRCLSMAKMLVAVYEHDLTELGAEVPRGFLVTDNITRAEYDKAVAARREARQNNESTFAVDVLAFFPGNPAGKTDIRFVPYSRLPVDFNLHEFSKWTMILYSVAFGYDATEFIPVQSGSFGRGQEAEIQAEKTTYKGEADFSLEHQNHINNQLPDTLDFTYDRNDSAGDLREIEARQAEVDVLNSMYQQPAGLESIITAEQYRQLAAESNLIPGEWITGEQETDATSDTERKRRAMRDNERVYRAAEMFPNDPIELMRFDPRTNRATVRRQWNSGDEFMRSIRIYPGVDVKTRTEPAPEPDPEPAPVDPAQATDPILRMMLEHDAGCNCGTCATMPEETRTVRDRVRREWGVFRDAQPGETVYEDEDGEFIITSGDIDLAITEAGERVGQEFEDILNAEIWNPDGDGAEDQERAVSAVMLREAYWDVGAQRYRDEDGKFISAATIRAYTRESIESNRDFAGGIAERISNGQLNTNDARELIRQELKREYIRQSCAGRGGRDRMDFSDWGRMGAMLKSQYKYLDGFMNDIDSMNLTEGQIRARLNMYFESTSQAYETFNAISKGVNPADLPQYPGDGKTICMTNCKCYWDIKPVYQNGVLIGHDCRWMRTVSESCDDCIALAAKYNPLELRYEAA